MRSGRRPDFVVLGPEWPIRALLRAQLLEAGYDVLAIDTWPSEVLSLPSLLQPRAIIIDLHGLPNPRDVLTELAALVPPERTLVVTALGTIDAEDVRRMGFHVVRRPARIDDIVAAAAGVLAVGTSAG